VKRLGYGRDFVSAAPGGPQARGDEQWHEPSGACHKPPAKLLSRLGLTCLFCGAGHSSRLSSEACFPLGKAAKPLVLVAGAGGLCACRLAGGPKPERGCPDSVSCGCCWEALVSTGCSSKRHKPSAWAFPSLVEQSGVTAAHLGQARN